MVFENLTGTHFSFVLVVLIHSPEIERNTLHFDVKGGVAKFGFACINANGPQRFAPYFQVDDGALLQE